MQNQKFGNNLINFLSGTMVLEEVKSSINGKITVVKSLAFGTYIQVGGLTQSGGIMHQVWRKPLKQISNFQFPISNVLILGLAGGTVAKLVKKNWPDAKITGVDIDPVMVKLGRKHLGLNKNDVSVRIADAYEYLIKNSQPKAGRPLDEKFPAKGWSSFGRKSQKFDLVLIDLYVGDEFPKKFESEGFIKLTRMILVNQGIAIFNRLYYGGKRTKAVRFEDKLEKIFKNVEIVFPEANVMFICRK